MKTICGIDCRECTHKDNCKGCVETNGHPLGGECVAARCYQSGGEKCFLQYKKEVLDEVNFLQIKDMPPVTTLFLSPELEKQGALPNIRYHDTFH